MALLEWLEELSVSGGAIVLLPAAIFAISVAFMGVVIFNLHRSMSKRNVLGIDWSGLRTSGQPLHLLLFGLAYLATYGLLFPFLAYVWFWLLAGMLAFLYNSKEAQELLMVAMAVLTAVRVTAYYNEELSRDISKILPYGLLGVFLINSGQYDLQASLDLLESMGGEEDSAFYFWVYISAQELALRITQPFLSASYDFLWARINNVGKRVMNRIRAIGGTTADSPLGGRAIAAGAVPTANDYPCEERK